MLDEAARFGWEPLVIIGGQLQQGDIVGEISQLICISSVVHSNPIAVFFLFVFCVYIRIYFVLV